MTTFPLRRLRLRSGEELLDRAAIQLEPFELGEQRYLPVPDVADAELTIQRATSADVYRLRFDTRLHGPCMRCLEDAVVDVTVDTREYHDGTARGDDELRSEYVVDDLLLLSVWARDVIAYALPVQVLCRLDCAGLCPVCGKNLNREPHTHAEEDVDARWETLRELRERL